VTGRGDHSRWVAALGVVLALAALTLPWSVPALVDGASRAPEQVTAQGTTPPPFVVEPVTELHGRAAHPPPERAAQAGTPVRLVVPVLGVDAPVLPIAAAGGVLLPPSNPQTLGWWRDGAVPGAARGGALITGHTVHTGGGAFDDLETLRRGDRVRVRTAKGVLDYRVTGVTIYRKATLARDAERVFSQTVPGRLVLITCEDWDGSEYLSNAVVFADRV
jgi:LPXTG-site transpeptidase (sortase) family protein